MRPPPASSRATADPAARAVPRARRSLRDRRGVRVAERLAYAATPTRARGKTGGFSALELTGIMTIVLVVASLLFCWGNSVATRAREVSCRSNLKQIATALLLYAHDHDGRLPPSAGAIPYLANTYVKNQQVFVCPVDPSPATIQFVPPPGPRPPFHQGKWPPNPPSPTTMQTSYFMVPGVATDDPPASIIAGETRPRHRGRWHAACLDGRIIAVPAAELPKYLPSGGERR